LDLDKDLSFIFDRVVERHNVITKTIEMNFPFMQENTFSEVRIIELIKLADEPMNVTKLAKKMNMTKGTISKLTQKLIQNEYIQKYQLGSNRKEVYFKLTRKGLEIHKQHMEMHEKRLERDMFYFKNLSDEEKKALKEMLEMIYEQITKKLVELDLHDYI
jgi:DNA-binding MarR family transcriptional regulator